MKWINSVRSLARATPEALARRARALRAQRGLGQATSNGINKIRVFLAKWSKKKDEGTDKKNLEIGEEKSAEYCPHCNSRKFVKRGKRKKKLEVVKN